MKRAHKTMYIGNLLNRKIVTAEGKRIGHVADLVLSQGPEYKVTALMYGRRGWLHRLHVLDPFTSTQSRHKKPYILPWEAIDRIEDSVIKLKPGYQPKETDIEEPEHVTQA